LMSGTLDTKSMPACLSPLRICCAPANVPIVNVALALSDF
jgi:hypothetical protein